MLTLLFIILLFVIFGKILIFAVKATWGIAKIVCTVVLFPFILICLVFAGLIKVALPLLLIAGVAALLLPQWK